VLLLLLSTLAFTSEGASAESRLSETRRKLRAARSKLVQVRRTDRELLAAISRLGGQLGSTRAHLAQAEGVLARLLARIHGEERRITRLEKQRSTRAAVVGKRARALYVMGPGVGAEALLSSESIEEFVNRSSSLDFAMSFDRRVMDELARIADQARKARASLARQQKVASGVRRSIAERAAELAEVLQTKQVAENALSAKVADYASEVRALEREQQRILEIIRARASHSTGRISRRGFIWPFRGRITSPYGPRWGGFHTGMDIDCETGQRIVAAKSGRVIAAEWGGGYGKMVIIDHGNGVSTLYAHNSRLYVSDGQKVGRGQRVSACGETGHAYGDHLHFEVRINGDHTNPRPFLP
jgi:murein DD-endopeptidase MepM/ murein hydrolase activator NlpD